MRADWEANRDALMAFWRSGKYTMTDDLAEFGIEVRMPPWIFFRGSRRTLPWAATEFDGGLARPAKRARQKKNERPGS